MSLKTSFFKTPLLLCIGLFLFTTCSKSNEDKNCSIDDLAASEQTRVVNFVNSAIEYLESTTNSVAFADFSDPDGNFIDQELYIFALDFDGNILAHGFNEELIGTNQYDLQDIDGRYITRDLIDTVDNQEGKGWACYFWDDPLTDDIQLKYSYAVTVGELIIASGTYVVQ